MGVFLGIVLGFPTVIWSILFSLVMLYWLVVLLGLLDTEVIESMFFDADAVDAGGLAGLLSRIGLGGVPVTVIVTLIVMLGWLVSYFAVYLLGPVMDWQVVNILLGAAIFAGSLFGGVVLTSLALRPVRALLRKVPQETPKVILGRVGVVRSGKVTPVSGYASVDDGGAGLVFQVRTVRGELPRGARVVLIEALPDQSAWRVVPEDEFNGF